MDPPDKPKATGDPVTYLKEITKLMNEIAKSSKSGSSVAQLKVMRQLRDQWSSGEPVLAVTACQGLLVLVEKGLVPVSAAIEMMVVAIPNIRNFAGVTSTIGTLLQWDLKAYSGEPSDYVCPYGIMKNQHPLIKLLLHCPDTWSDVFTVIQNIARCREPDSYPDHHMTLLRPVFEFVLCDPQAKPFLPSSCRRQLWAYLLKTLSNEFGRELVLKSLQWMQLKQKERAVEAGCFLLELCEVVISTKDVPLCMALAPFVASHSRTLVSLAVDPSMCLGVLRELVQVAPESSSCSALLLAETISACPAAYLDTVIITCQNLVKLESTSHVSACAVTFALLPWFAAPSVLTNDALIKARSLVLFIYNNSTRSLYKQPTSTLSRNVWFALLRHCDCDVHIAAAACRISEMWRSKEDISGWLSRLRNADPDTALKLLPLVAALLLSGIQQNDDMEKSSQDPDEEPVLKTLLWLAKLFPSISQHLFFLFTHALTKERRPLMQIGLLRAIPGTAHNQDTVPFVLAMLRAMRAESATAKNLAIDLYFRLWSLQSRCFPFLHEALSSDSKNESYKITWQTDLTRAFTIKQICLMKPEAHSQDLLPIVSSILAQHSASAGALPASLCLDSIATLSRSGILDVVSAWRSLTNKLSNEKRPLVIISICDLLGLMGRLPTGDKTPDTKYETVVEEAITKLWHYVSMAKTCPEDKIVNAALRALSQFSVNQMKLKMVPPFLRRHVALDPAYIKTPVDAAKNPVDVYTYIPDQVWKNLILTVGSRPECRETLCETLASWVGTELASLPRNVFVLLPNRSEPPSFDRLPKASVLRALYTFSTAEETRSVALDALSRELPRQLPPVKWQFLEDAFLNCSESSERECVRRSCLTIAAKQCTVSGSATQFLMNYMSGCDISQNKMECELLFKNLHLIGKAIPASYINSFVISGLQYAVTSFLSETDSEGIFLQSLLEKLEVALQKTVTDEFTKAVAHVVEDFCNAINPSHSVYPAYVSCAAKLPVKNRDRLTLPSLWWETNTDKLKLAVWIQSAVLSSENYDMPLALLNECIDSAASAGHVEQDCVLDALFDAIFHVRNHESNSQWICQLLGRIQRVTINDAHLETKKQVVQMLCDVLMLSTIVLSGFEIFSVEDRLVIVSREERLLHFPQALATLLKSNSSWKAIGQLVINWLQYMSHSETVSSLLTETFSHALVAVRYEESFRCSKLWMNALA